MSELKCDCTKPVRRVVGLEFAFYRSLYIVIVKVCFIDGFYTVSCGTGDHTKHPADWTAAGCFACLALVTFVS